MTANKPENTKAPNKRTAASGKTAKVEVEGKVVGNEPETKLAEVDPATVTDKQINEMTGDGLKPEQDGTNKEDAAETMQRNRDVAKHPEKGEERGYFHGQGGAVGL